MEERGPEKRMEFVRGEGTLDTKDEMETDAPTPSDVINVNGRKLLSEVESAKNSLPLDDQTRGSNCDMGQKISTPLVASEKKDYAGRMKGDFVSATDESNPDSSGSSNCSSGSISISSSSSSRQMADSLRSFPTAASTTASAFAAGGLAFSPPTNAPLSCVITASMNAPTAPPIDGLLTIATPNLLKYGHAKKALLIDDDDDDDDDEDDDEEERFSRGEPAARLFADQKDLGEKLPAEDDRDRPVAERTGADAFRNAVSSFRPATSAASSTPFLRHRRDAIASNKSAPRSFSPPVLRSAVSSASQSVSSTTSSGSSSSTTTMMTTMMTTTATSLNTTPTFSPCKPTSGPSSGLIMPSSLSPFTQQQHSRQQQGQQQQQPSPQLKATPRRDLRLDFHGGSISLKRCNSAPAIDLKLTANLPPTNHPFLPTTPTTPTSESASVACSQTPPIASAHAAPSSSLFSQNSLPPSPFLPSPTRRASASLFRPISTMSPSASVEGSDVVGRRNRRFSSNSVGGGTGGSARSTSPYPLPRTPSRLEQILNDECRNPLAREEADEREMNEVQSISSSCDKLDLLGIENSSSAFGTNNLSLLGNNNNNNNNIGNNEDEASSTGSQPGRGLSAAFGLDFASSVASTPAALATTPVAAAATSRPSPVPSSPRNRTNSDPMAGSLIAASAVGCSTPAPTLHLSINLNSAAAGSSSQGSPSTVANCSPSPTSGCGGLSNVGKQRFSPRRQVSYHPASPINRRSLSPLANTGHNGIKRKIHPAELSWSCLAGGQDFEPLNKFPRTSLSRGSTPERGFPTPTASPGLSPRGSSSSTASTQQTASSGGGAGTTTTSAGVASSALSAAGSLPSSPSTPQPPSPSTLSGGCCGNPFSRSDSPTTPASGLVGGGGGKFPSLPFQDAPPHRRHLSVISNVSSSSADSSFSSLDESGGNAALNFAGFSAAPSSTSSQSSSSAIHFCMTPPSNGSPAPPQQQPQQQSSLRSKAIDDDDDDAEIPAGKFTWPNDDDGNEVENAVSEGQSRGGESRDKVEESGESRDGDETANAAPMETDAS